jgi:hypothetical protein
MPAGDASRTWFSEMIETLQEWKPEIAWEQVIASAIGWMLCSKRFVSPEASGRRRCGALSATGTHSRLRRMFRFELLYWRLVVLV